MGRVVFSVSTYWPSVNGEQHVTTYQAEGLDKLGHDVTVITSDLGETSRRRGAQWSKEMHLYYHRFNV